MISLTELPNIPVEKSKKAQAILDDLLLENNVISGYNWYATVPRSTRIVTFSHMHETEEYKKAMISDLLEKGYTESELEKKIRTKFGSYHWREHFIFRDDDGAIFPGLRIRKQDGTHVELSKYQAKTLEGIAELDNLRLVGEDEGWELNIPFQDETELVQLADIFLKKSSRQEKNHWPGAYDVPVLLIGEGAIAYVDLLPDFTIASKIALVENENEISFVINSKLPVLKIMPHFTNLSKLGFKEESCLANKSFIDSYVDKR